MLDLATIIERFRHNATAISALVAGVGQAQARWRPTAEDWSILEVINHLYDEEREDFRTRLDITLHRPETPWPPIDPQGWVKARDYNSRDLAGSVAAWLAEREASLAWLAGLDAPNWQSAAVHPVFGAMVAGSLLAAWLAHDYLHLRQLIELQYLYARQQALPFDVDYAGDW
jgi:hypothetical protein